MTTGYRAVVRAGHENWTVEVPDFGYTLLSRRIDGAETVAHGAITSARAAAGVPSPLDFRVEMEMGDPYAPDMTLPMVVVVDIDGTLALRNHRGPYEFDKVETDDVNEPVLMVMEALESEGHGVILLSGRQEEYREHTERWLEKNNISYKELRMRPKGDRRSDCLVKLELFDTHVRDKFYAWLVLDDRDRCIFLWRKLGLTCFQVAPGSF